MDRVKSHSCSNILSKSEEIASTQAAPPRSLAFTEHKGSCINNRKPVRIQTKHFNLRRAVLSSISIFLLCTDVIRTKMVPYFEAKQLNPNVFYTFGPYAYSQGIISKNLKDTSYSSETENKVWAYKYDTVSRAMRGILHHDGSNIFPDCIFYKSDCEGSTLTNEVTFNMLDGFVDHLVNRTVTGLKPRPKMKTYETGLKFEGVISAGYVDFVVHFILHHVYSPRVKHLNVKGWYYDGNLARNRTEPICDQRFDTPDGCTSALASFKTTTFPDNYLHNMGNHIIHTENRLRETQEQFPNHTVDLAVIESFSYPYRAFGGLSTTSSHELEVVTLIRVRECSTSQCKTVQIEDYRYEGAVDVTDIFWWNNLIKMLRFTAQGYYFIRIIGLILGTYFSGIVNGTGNTPKTAWAKWKLTLRILSHIPSQITVYSAFFPVFIYATAHTIDSCVTYTISNRALSTVGGVSISNLIEVFERISMNMRNIWVYGSLAIVAAWIQNSHNWQREAGVQGIVGYFVGLVSFLSLFTSNRYRSMRDTRIVATWDIFYKDSASTSLEDFFEPDSTYLSGSGIDLVLFGLITAVYLLIFYLMRSVVHLFTGYSYFGDSLRLIRTTRSLPVTAGLLWSPACLAMSWDSNLFDVSLPSLHQPAKLHPKECEAIELSEDEYLYRACLMNITMLSDPFRYILVRYGNLRLFKFIGPNGEVVYSENAALNVSTSERVTKHVNGSFRLVEVIEIGKQSWQEIIRYA